MCVKFGKLANQCTYIMREEGIYMVYGIGSDILNIKTIEPSVRDSESSFVKKIYTQKERELILSRDIPLYCYATRFAGKEAVFKTFGVDGNTFRLNDIEILENETGQPQVILHNKALLVAKELGISKVFISLSYDTDYVVAYATAIRE